MKFSCSLKHEKKWGIPLLNIIVCVSGQACEHTLGYSRSLLLDGRTVQHSYCAQRVH